MATNHSSLPIIWRSGADPVVYERARVGRVFNHRRPKRYPIAVVEATEESHVIEAVLVAVEQGFRVSVRSGGHSWAAWSVRDEAILIDLGKYRLIDLDESRKMVSVSPSTTGRMLNSFLDTKGSCLREDTARMSNSAGSSYKAEWAGIARIGAGPGDLLRCDTKQNSGIFWTARGSGPGFPGVVTKFHLQVQLRYNNMLSSTFIYPISEYRRVIKWILEITSDYDKDTEVAAVGATPPGISFPCIIPLFVTFKNTLEEARAALSLANKTRPEGPLVELLNQPKSLAKEYRDQGAANPEGHRCCSDNTYIKNNADVAASSKKLSLLFQTPKLTPCDHYFALYTIWEAEDNDERCLKWVRDIMKDVERHSEGAYLGDSDFQVRKTKFWSDENAQRLMQIRKEWDPEGTICGYLDVNDASGVNGLANKNEWQC